MDAGVETPLRLGPAPRRPSSRTSPGLSVVGAGGTVLAMPRALERITADPHVCGGQPCVRGLRIPVSVVLKHVAAGKTPVEIVAELPELEVDDIRDCLQYAVWLASGRTIELPSAA